MTPPSVVVLAASLGGRPGGGRTGRRRPTRKGPPGRMPGGGGRSLVVAGGADSPGKKPWESGKKVWHDTVYVLDRPAGAWWVAGTLPRPLGYGGRSRTVAGWPAPAAASRSAAV